MFSTYAYRQFYKIIQIRSTAQKRKFVFFAGYLGYLNLYVGYLWNHLLQVEPECEPVPGIAADVVHNRGLIQPTLHLYTNKQGERHRKCLKGQCHKMFGLVFFKFTNMLNYLFKTLENLFFLLNFSFIIFTDKIVNRNFKIKKRQLNPFFAKIPNWVGY